MNLSTLDSTAPSDGHELLLQFLPLGLRQNRVDLPVHGLSDFRLPPGGPF